MRLGSLAIQLTRVSRRRFLGQLRKDQHPSPGLSRAGVSGGKGGRSDKVHGLRARAGGDLPAWLTAEREGSGRDPRLLGVPVMGTSVPPFRVAFGHAAGSASQCTTPLSSRSTVNPRRLESIPAMDELREIIASSSTSDFAVRFLERSGLTAQSPLGREYIYTMYTLWALVCLFWLDVTRLRAGEHLCRPMLQIDKAF